MKIGFIGLGNMAKAMIGGMLQMEIVQTGDIFGSARSRETLEAVRAGYGIGTRDSNVAVAGEADVLIFPNIESGNAFYKAVSLFSHADMAGLLQGPVCPVVLPSRSDSGLSKYYSIAMACLTASDRCDNPVLVFRIYT